MKIFFYIENKFLSIMFKLLMGWRVVFIGIYERRKIRVENLEFINERFIYRVYKMISFKVYSFEFFILLVYLVKIEIK